MIGVEPTPNAGSPSNGASGTVVVVPGGQGRQHPADERRGPARPQHRQWPPVPKSASTPGIRPAPRPVTSVVSGAR
ncbi:hypothetical protein BIV25_32815 [Streptomyces sp. MUSC 14]|uniref:hypothetical protein n=1 Tax=Streptomyces sp. MUSC 14 TaxID=1354889 RepID=UPI0008F5B295|nr:hypothetical protein [Streptomyces sp. MUSC 14]OIJ90081.1 hypothetical protein BIV25_32815 [Streptomyces sp. MUSC 14]